MSAESGSVRWEPHELLELDEAQLRQEFRRLEKDRLFFNAHVTDLYEQYRGKYVAIYQEDLAAVAATMEELVNQLDAKGIRPGLSYWQFLSSEKAILVPSAWMILD